MMISLIVLLIGMGSVFLHRGWNTSIDFAGGTLVEVRFVEQPELQGIRDVIANAGFEGAEVTYFGEEKEVLIKVKRIGEAAEAAGVRNGTFKSRLSRALKELRKNII